MPFFMIGVDAGGLYLGQVIRLPRLRKVTWSMRVPWDEVSVEMDTSRPLRPDFHEQPTLFRFSQAPSVPIQVSSRMARRILRRAAEHGAVPAEITEG